MENQLYQSVKQIIEKAREHTYHSVNTILLQTYWLIGQIIIEKEQGGKDTADYGKGTLKNLSLLLTQDFGKGFDMSNLTNMRKFYLAFPIFDAVRQELSWTHYRLLSRLDTSEKRNYYLQESIACNWNSRELQRQINA